MTHRSAPRLLTGAALALAAAACARPAPPMAGSAAEPDVAFVGVHVVPMGEGAALLRDQTVLVRRGRIAAVGPAASVPVPRGAVRVDGAGRYLFPGLTDAHVHLEHSTDPAILALFVASGVTTVRSMDGRPHVLRWRDEVRRGTRVGPSIRSAGPILDGDPPLRDDHVRVRTAADGRAEVLRQKAAGYDFVKVYNNLGTDAYRGVVEAAREAGLPVAGHVPRAVRMEGVLGAGQHSVEHLADLGMAAEADDSPTRGRWHWSKLFLAAPMDSARMEELGRRAAAAGTWIVPTLVERHRAAAPAAAQAAWEREPQLARVPAEWRRIWADQLRRTSERMDAEDWERIARGAANRRATVRILHRAGARLLVGTDTPNPYVVPGFALHEEMDALIDAGVPRAVVLAAATREAARFMGEEAERGTLEPGKRADLLLVRANPLDDHRTLRDPQGVMVRGRWHTADELARGLRPGGGEQRE